MVVLIQGCVCRPCVIFEGTLLSMVFCIASFKACQSDSISLEVQYEVRQANKKYMEDVSTDYKENSKKFWSFIKSKGQEWTGVAPLKNKMGFVSRPF
jgi:hypothetical protein